MLTTISKVKARLKGVGEEIPQDHDELLTDLIAEQSAVVEEFCRRRLVKATYTGEQHTGLEGQTEFYPLEWPINAVSSVSIDGTAVVAGTGSDNYVLLKSPSPLHETWALYRENSWKSDPHKLLTTYTAGYVLASPTGADVLIRDDLLGAVSWLVAGAYLLRGKAGVTRESFEGFTIDSDRWPTYIVQALSKYQRQRF